MKNNKEKRIEIEFRSQFDKKKYKKLKRFLKKNAMVLGEDDKDVYFFTLRDKLIKVVDNVSKKNAKIVLKLNRIGKGSDFEEIEIPIERKNVKNMVEFVSKMDVADLMIHSFQKRINYKYEGVELALKHSREWGFHLELEVLISDINGKKTAEKRIYKVAKKLDVKIMTENELKELVRRVENKYKKN